MELAIVDAWIRYGPGIVAVGAPTAMKRELLAFKSSIRNSLCFQNTLGQLSRSIASTNELLVPVVHF